jgi:hypothetical protein
MKTSWEDSFKRFGEELLEKLIELHPETKMVGQFKTPSPGEIGYQELYFIIKKGGGFLARNNPFAKKLVQIYEHEDGGPWRLPMVTIYDYTLIKSIKQIVPEVNNKRGRSFSVEYG